MQNLLHQRIVVLSNPNLHSFTVAVTHKSQIPSKCQTVDAKTKKFALKVPHLVALVCACVCEFVQVCACVFVLDTY